MHPHLKMFAGALLVWTFLRSEVPAQSPDSVANPKARVPPQLPSTVMPPVPPSPIDYFRKLIEASPAERGKLLEGKPADHRLILTNSLRAYLELSATEREARLRTLDVRFYLTPLLQSAATNRAQALAAVPDVYRQIVGERLAAWDRLPVVDRQQLMEKEGASRLASVIAPPMPPLPPGLSMSWGHTNSLRVSDKAMSDWQKYPEAKRQEILARVDRLSNVPMPREAMDTLPLTDAERLQIQKTLERFRNLSPAQRGQVLSTFQKFAGLSPDERRQFLRNAEAWQAMSAEEREHWRYLVNNLPELPPQPPSMPPAPPASGRKVSPTGMLVSSNSGPVGVQ